MFSSVGVNKVTLSFFHMMKWTKLNQTSLRPWEVQQNLRYRLYHVLLINYLEFTSFMHTFRCTNSFRKTDHSTTRMASFTTERISNTEYRLRLGLLHPNFRRMYPQVSLFHFIMTGPLILSLTDVPSTVPGIFEQRVFLFGIQYSWLTSLYEYIYFYFMTIWKKYYLMINISSFCVKFPATDFVTDWRKL